MFERCGAGEEGEERERAYRLRKKERYESSSLSSLLCASSIALEVKAKTDGNGRGEGASDGEDDKSTRSLVARRQLFLCEQTFASRERQIASRTNDRSKKSLEYRKSRGRKGTAIARQEPLRKSDDDERRGMTRVIRVKKLFDPQTKSANALRKKSLLSIVFIASLELIPRPSSSSVSAPASGGKREEGEEG